MALCVRSVGIMVNHWLPDLTSSLSLTQAVTAAAAERVGKNGRRSRVSVGVVCCSSVQREADILQPLGVDEKVDMEDELVEIMCEICNGSGWVLCKFCNGQKTNVKSKSSRFYRRCPNCKAVSSINHPSTDSVAFSRSFGLY
ncbi:hypothetical protein HPP92_017108 [Vanilla planifolia]|uniref:Uncharacterized protein n=1 Tax=Vanilla planifolia TaxID=51239 RepID=A0A835UQQ1_VANPL|nr:hypothetical protein HPP92_017108 [Vanilla planifolia]